MHHRLIVAALVALAACVEGNTAPPPDNGGGGGGATATVLFAYEAPTAVDPAVAAQFPRCVNGVGRTHIHPSWRGFSRIDMTAVGSDRWEIRFTDVPTGLDQSLRISDPNACRSDPNGASTANVFANGVRLLRVVGTPGNGTEPGLAFRVAAGGTVTP